MPAWAAPSLGPLGAGGSRATPRAWAAPFEGFRAGAEAWCGGKTLGAGQGSLVLGDTGPCATSASQGGETGKGWWMPWFSARDPWEAGDFGCPESCGSLRPSPCGVWGSPLPCSHFPPAPAAPMAVPPPLPAPVFPWQLFPQLFLSLQPQPRALGTGNVGAAGEEDFPEPLH